MRIASVILTCLVVAACAVNAADQSFSGVGIELALEKGSVLVKRAVPGSPADQVGVPAGSVIVSIEGRSVSGLGLAKVTEMLRGPEGSRVSLTVRQDPGVTQSFTLTRARLSPVTPESFPGVYRFQDAPDVEMTVTRAADGRFVVACPRQHWSGIGVIGNGCFKGVFQMEDVPEVQKEFRGAVSFIRIDFQFGDTLLLRSKYNFFESGDRMVEKTLVRKPAR